MMRRAALGALAAKGWSPDLLTRSCNSFLELRSITGFAPLSRIWDNVFRKSKVQLLEERLANATAKHEEETADLSQRLDALQRKVTFLFRRNEKLSEQLGFLNEVAIREAVGKLHGKEAAEQAHIHSLQGLCTLLLPKNIPSRQREADLAARQSALIEALTTPESFTSFLGLFLGRLTEYHEGNRRALAYIRKAQAATAEVSLHLGKKATVNRGRVIEAALTQIRTLEAVICQDSNQKEDKDPDGIVAVDELEPEDIKTIPPAYWAGRFFSGLIKYLRAAKGGLIKLRAHLAEPDSLGIALLAAASSQLMCVNFELDGRGSLEVFPDGAVITVFEYKSSPSGFAKGKRQLAARLAMLMWAVRGSGAVPAGVPVTGRGHLYLPGYARMRPQELALEGGNMTITIASI